MSVHVDQIHFDSPQKFNLLSSNDMRQTEPESIIVLQI